MKDQRIDIMQELVELNQHEEMLAFFEFNLERPGSEPVAGLCKISKPKGGGDRLPYLSLTFMVDTPDDASTATVETALAQLERDAFKASLPSVVEVVTVPSMTSGSENSVRQLDIMLAEHVDPGQPFIMDRLLPALRSFAGLQAKQVVWWDTATESPAAPHNEATSAEAAPASLLNNLRAYLKRLVDAERK
jgi:hypothetical protein